MRKRSCLEVALALIGFLILIFDSRHALEGAQEGIELCIKTVIPSLFPFFMLSSVLTNAFCGFTTFPMQRISGLLGIPSEASPVLITAVLGGYPVGAKSVADLYQSGQISREHAERLLAFCSNAGPSFLFGMVSGFFPDRTSVMLLWLIHIFSAVLTAATIPSPKISVQTPGLRKSCKHNSAVLSALKAMGLVCSWVILFRVWISFLERWCLWLLPGWTQVLLTGILELTNGCCALPVIEDQNLRFVMCACLLAFGGICVLLQTASVTEGLSLRCYLRGKLKQTIFSFLLSCAVVSGQGLLIAGSVPILVLILRKTEKRYGNPTVVPV